MHTLYLCFADRAAALAALASVLGYQSSAEEPGGREMLPVGMFGPVRYDLCFIADAGVPMTTSGDHVNLLWWGDAASAPDFGAHIATPATPSCSFAP